MKFFFTLILFTTLSPLFSNAQSNYKAGYVVTLKGDTINGFIDYKEWGRNPTQIDFKKATSDSKTQTYTPANVDFISINGYDYYKRFVGKISTGEVLLSRLSDFIDTSYSVGSVFLKVIGSGKNITLYKYTDEIKERFFVAESAGMPEELIYRRYLDAQATTALKEVNTYQRQLQRIAVTYQPQNTALLGTIQSANYKLVNLQEIAETINGSKTRDLFYSDSNISSSRFFIGAAITNTITTSQAIPEFAGLKSTSIFPEITAGVDLFFNKKIRKLVFRTALSISGNAPSFTGNGTNVTPYVSNYKFTQYIIGLNPQLLYNAYNENTFKIYLAAGVKIDYSIYKNIEYYRIYTVGSTQTRGDLAPFDMKSAYLNITARAGIIVSKKLDIYIGFEPSNYISLVTNTYSLQAGINFLFDK